MVHNGIEYGLMQAYAEGFALLRAETDLQLDLRADRRAWRHGTRDPLLAARPDGRVPRARTRNWQDIAPVVADSGEGRWTALEAIELGIPRR